MFRSFTFSQFHSLSKYIWWYTLLPFSFTWQDHMHFGLIIPSGHPLSNECWLVYSDTLSSNPSITVVVSTFWYRPDRPQDSEQPNCETSSTCMRCTQRHEKHKYCGNQTTCNIWRCQSGHMPWEILMGIIIVPCALSSHTLVSQRPC